MGRQDERRAQAASAMFPMRFQWRWRRKVQVALQLSSARILRMTVLARALPAIRLTEAGIGAGFASFGARLLSAKRCACKP